MQIVTITSDWGKEDYYIATLAGTLLNVANDINFIPVTNNIKQYNIIEGCFILKHSFFHFPIGTIHLMAVNSEMDDQTMMAIVKHRGHWFITPNDGRFSLLIDSCDEFDEYYLMPDKYKKGTFSALAYFREGVRLIINNKLNEVYKTTNLKQVSNNIPAIHGMNMIGVVQYIDSYGNAISNITKKNFIDIYLRLQKELEYEPEFEIFVASPLVKLDTIDIVYNDVNNGEVVALFNSLDLLEFAINNGNFSRMESVEIGDEIIIKFK